MILIKRIEFIETDRDPYQIIDSCSSPHECVPVLDDEGAKVGVPISQVIELVQGRRFCRPNGEEMIIGVSKQAANVIGIQYEAWENQEKKMDELSDAWRELHTKHHDALKASLWTRFKWLFRGYA